MPRICFVAEDGTELGRVDAARGGTLLELARQYEIPLHWRCGLGTCGTCRVKLRHAGQPARLTLAPRTRNVMQRAGLLAPEAPTLLVDDENLWRLACHVEVQDDDLTVIVPPPAP